MDAYGPRDEILRGLRRANLASATGPLVLPGTGGNPTPRGAPVGCRLISLVLRSLRSDPLHHSSDVRGLRVQNRCLRRRVGAS